jgi:endoglucanase
MINPSYLSPAHFRIFFACTGDPRWNDLIEGSYHLIETVSKSFAGVPGVGVVPDWLLLTTDGALTRAKGFSDRFGWDAIRTPWRIGMDALWFEEDRAKRYLDGMRVFYTQEWERHGNRFFAEYTYEGRPAGRYEHIAAYAMSLSALSRSNSPVLTGVLEKLRNAFNKEARLFEDSDDYYANSLVLLALIFYREGTLPTFDPKTVVCR